MLSVATELPSADAPVPQIAGEIRVESVTFADPGGAAAVGDLTRHIQPCELGAGRTVILVTRRITRRITHRITHRPESLALADRVLRREAHRILARDRAA